MPQNKSWENQKGLKSINQHTDFNCWKSLGGKKVRNGGPAKATVCPGSLDPFKGPSSV